MFAVKRRSVVDRIRQLGRLENPNRAGMTTRLGSVFGVAAAALAAALANHALAVRAERRDPPQGQFVTMDGVRLHYVERGKGVPVIVMLHGNGTMARDFVQSGVLDALAKDHRVVAF